MINLDEFREYISIMHPVEYRDGAGQIKQTWQVLAPHYASKYNWQNRDKYEGQNLINSDIAVFKIYYDNRVNTSHKIYHEGKSYQITGIKEIGYREALEITAQFKSNL